MSLLDSENDSQQPMLTSEYTQPVSAMSALGMMQSRKVLEPYTLFTRHSGVALQKSDDCADRHVSVVLYLVCKVRKIFKANTKELKSYGISGHVIKGGERITGMNMRITICMAKSFTATMKKSQSHTTKHCLSLTVEHFTEDKQQSITIQSFPPEGQI